MGSDGSEPIVPKKKQKFSKKENVDIINKRVTEVDSKWVYAGLYTVRSAYIEYSNIKLEVK